MRTVHQIIYCEDTAESHAENSFNRAKLYRKYILLPMAIITFIISLLKHIEKCNYEEDGGNIPQRIAENYLSIRNLYTSFYSIKFLSMFLIFVWLSQLKHNIHVSRNRPKYLMNLVISGLLSLISLAFAVLIATSIIPTNTPLFQSIFFIDLTLLGFLSSLSIYLRESELNILIDISVYKSVDSMKDKELF